MELLQNDGVLFTLKQRGLDPPARDGRAFLILSTTEFVATHCTASGKAASFKGCLHQAQPRTRQGLQES